MLSNLIWNLLCTVPCSSFLLLANIYIDLVYSVWTKIILCEFLGNFLINSCLFTHSAAAAALVFIWSHFFWLLDKSVIHSSLLFGGFWVFGVYWVYQGFFCWKELSPASENTTDNVETKQWSETKTSWKTIKKSEGTCRAECHLSFLFHC